MTCWAALLRVACYLAQEKVPDFGTAVGAIVLLFVVNLVVRFMLAALLMNVSGGNVGRVNSTLMAIDLPISAFLAAHVYMFMMGLKFTKALLVWLIQAGIVFVIGLVFYLVFSATGVI